MPFLVEKAHPLYQVYVNMVQRCHNPNCTKFPDYGGRGILVCDEWKQDRDTFFEWALKTWKQGLTLDRIDNNSGYSPNNCRFTDWETQQNNRRDNVVLEHNGESLTIEQWSRRQNIPASVIAYRLGAGYSVRNALTMKPKEAVSKMVSWNGKTLAMRQWDELNGWTPGTVRYRLKAGWTLERALTEPPVRKKRGRG